MNDDSPSIRQSILRLEKARHALGRFKQAKTFSEAESAWGDLLIAGNAIYSKLEQGCKKNGRAAAWFGRVKKIRKDDQLLSYMHHARNSEEHGIEDITRRVTAGQATLTIREPFDARKLDGVSLRISTDARGHVQLESSNEDVISTRMYPDACLSLARVTDDRYKDHFDPPYEHLGEKLMDQSPQAVGALFLDYLTRLIDEAKGLQI